MLPAFQIVQRSDTKDQHYRGTRKAVRRFRQSFAAGTNRISWKKPAKLDFEIRRIIAQGAVEAVGFPCPTLINENWIAVFAQSLKKAAPDVKSHLRCRFRSNLRIDELFPC